MENKRGKGFSYYLEDEKIIEYLKLSDEDKLKWLEEIRVFTLAFLTKEEMDLRNRLRNGEV